MGAGDASASGAPITAAVPRLARSYCRAFLACAAGLALPGGQASACGWAITAAVARLARSHC
ncbi:MAG TPA: hypothetical protein VFS62_05365, partial [Chloroflexota bacterium]|nr:hypothetical protein [Chloroflexota bacterium]